jgi:hypothetical protein
MSSFQKSIMSPLFSYNSSIILKTISIKVDCNIDIFKNENINFEYGFTF